MPVTTVREMVLAAGVLGGRHECNLGTAFQLFKLKAGSPGREANIHIEGLLEIEVRVKLLIQSLPGY